jgi:hypothetical protein
MGETDECKRGRSLVGAIAGVGAVIALVFLIGAILRISAICSGERLPAPSHSCTGDIPTTPLPGTNDVPHPVGPPIPPPSAAVGGHLGNGR